MLNIVLFGPPGAGKGTQSQKLVEKYNLVHLSTGDLLRSEISNGTSLGMQAKAIMDRGELVSDGIVIGMIESKLDAHPDAKGFIFDGFPRTTAQAEALDELLKSKNKNITMMLALEVDNAELTRRLLSRGQETGRPDDQNEEIIRNRVNEYNTKTAPLKQYYSHQGKFHSVYGIGDVDQIFELLCATIENKTREKNHVHNDGTVTVADISFDDEPKHSHKHEPEVEIEFVEMPEAEERKAPAVKKTAVPAKKKAAPAKPAVKKTAASTPLSKRKAAKKTAPKKAAKKIAKKVASARSASLTAGPLSKRKAAKKTAAKKIVKKTVKKAAPKKVAKKQGPKKAIKKATKKIAKKVTSVGSTSLSKRKAVKKSVKKMVKKAVKKTAPKKTASTPLSKRKTAKPAKKAVTKKAVKKAIKKSAPKKMVKKTAKKVAPKKTAKKKKR